MKNRPILAEQSLLLGMLYLLAPASLRPQTSDPNKDDKTYEMEKLVVKDVAITDQVSPLQRPISSIYGTSMSILDTPRSVTAINSAQLRDESILQVTDFSKIVSNSYTVAQFGGPNIPYLRGQSAEVFQNGMLRTPRSDGQPLSFNSVEGFDVVKGPPTAVLGPTGNVGGYVNLLTKRPLFDGHHGAFTVIYGDYNTRRAQIDFGGPLTSNLAYRVSVEGEDSGSYFRFQHTQSTDVYLALRYLPQPDLTIDFNTELYTADYFENTGINRPTQQLIDAGIYIQGPGIGKFSSPTAADRRGFLSLITPTGTVKINRRLGLVAPSDGDAGKNYQAQLDVTKKLSNVSTLANKSYFELYTQDQQEFAQRYYNTIKESYNFEDRLELRETFTRDEIVTGAAFRYMHVLAYGDFFNEYLNATDITSDPTKFPITSLFGVVSIPGDPTQFAAPGASYPSPLYPFSIGNTQKSDAYQFGVFFQDAHNFSNQLTLLSGLRWDAIAEKLVDPLPPPGFAPVKDSMLVGLGGGNASLTYKPESWVTYYGTFNFNQSAVTSNGGGFATFKNNHLTPSDFHVRNFLYEIGAKFGLLDNTLFISSAAYYQKRSATDQFSTTRVVDVLGYEIEANYQPNKHFSATSSIGYLDAWLPHTNPTSFTRSVYDAFTAPTGTGVGSPNFTPNPLGTYRIGGLPHFLINGFAKYRSNFGLGASLGFVITSPIPTTELGDVVIPTQFNVDAALIYEEGQHWEARLDFYNITNEKNWTSNAGAIGADLISPNLPFHVQATVRYRF